MSGAREWPLKCTLQPYIGAVYRNCGRVPKSIIIYHNEKTKRRCEWAAYLAVLHRI